MSSSEEYLDNLLKAIMEGNTSEEPSPSMMQDVREPEGEQGASAPEEPDMMMNSDDIEAVFVSTNEEPEEAAPSNDEMLSDGLLVGEGTLLDGMALDEAMLSDEHMMNEETVTDELAMDDGILPDELAMDGGLLPNELSMNDEVLSDELMSDEGMLSDELALDDSVLSEELAPDDEEITDDFALTETETDNFIREESVEENAGADDLSFDELGLGELGLEELGLGEIEQDEPEANDSLALEDEPGAGEDFVLGDVAEGDDGFALEESGEDDAELAALLASMGADDDLSEINDLLEKSDQGVVVDDDIMAMLGDVSGAEEDDDSLDFLSIEGDPEDIREITPDELADRGKESRKAKQQKKKAEKERKKREKLAKKAKNKNTGEEGADDLNSLLTGMDEAGDKPKSKGALSKFLDFLLEEDEEEGDGSGKNSGDNGAGLASLTEENKELLAELQAEDKKNAKKKDKKEKKAKKDKKDKGGEKAEAKPKKPKKEKVKKEKKKKEKIEEPQVPEKTLSKKKVVSVFIFCATIAASIIVVTILLPDQLEKQEARVAFDQSQYTQVYELLYGKELSEEDEVLMQKSGTILKLQRKLDSYENYKRMDMPLEALDALLEGVSRYQNLRNDAELYNVSGEVMDIYGRILDTLEYNYGLSEADALDIIASEDDVTYSRRIQAVISGESFGMDEPVLPEGKQDVLPEEEEIIDRLEEQMEEEEITDGLGEQMEEEENIDGLEDTDME